VVEGARASGGGARDAVGRGARARTRAAVDAPRHRRAAPHPRDRPLRASPAGRRGGRARPRGCIFFPPRDGVVGPRAGARGRAGGWFV